MMIQKIRDVKSPSYATEGSAGLDFYIPRDFKDYNLAPGTSINIPSGIKTSFSKRYALIAFNKSGRALQGLQVGACVIDSDYQGEIHLHVTNIGGKTITLQANMKLVQFILIPVIYEVAIITTDDIHAGESERGTGGFGSTNNK